MKKNYIFKLIVALLFPLGMISATANAQTVIFSEDFNTFTDGTGGNDGSWSGQVAGNRVTATDLPGWTFNADNDAFKGLSSLKLGTGSRQGFAQTPALTALNGNATLTFRAGAWNNDQTELLLEIEGGGTLDAASVTMVNNAFSSFSVNIVGGTSTTKITFKGKQAANSRFFLDDVVVTSIPSNQVLAPSFDPPAGNYTSAISVSITSATEGAAIRYTLDGSDPTETSTVYSSPISISSTTTLKAIALKAEMTTSGITVAEYSFPNQVATIAALRASEQDGTVYELTGEAIITLQTTSRNTKYIQDATGGILIDDYSGTITTTYNVGDGITGIYGTISPYNGMLQFVPVSDPGAATSTGNTVTPAVTALADLPDHQGELVTVQGVSFTQTGVFAASTTYAFNESSSVVVRTQYSDLPYIGEDIPTGSLDITGVVLIYNQTTQIIPRVYTDIRPATASDKTNPISSAKIFADNGTIYVSGTDAKAIEVYSAQGQLISKTANNLSLNEIAVPAGQLYIVKAGADVAKVLVK